MDLSSFHVWKRSFTYRDNKYEIFDRTQRSPEITSPDNPTFNIMYDLIVMLGTNKIILKAFYMGWGSVIGERRSMCSISAQEDILEDINDFCNTGMIDMPNGCKISKLDPKLSVTALMSVSIGV